VELVEQIAGIDGSRVYRFGSWPSVIVFIGGRAPGAHLAAADYRHDNAGATFPRNLLAHVYQ
jgi:hypothetical protein